MTDSQLVALLVATLSAGMAARGRPAAVLQSYQPEQQGTEPTGPAVYLHKIGSKAYGFLGRRTVAGAAPAGQVNHRENQYWERSFQVNALAPLPPEDVTSPTAFDYIVATKAVLTSDAGRKALRAGGVGILRVTDVREQYIKNDRDQYELAPSFDFTVTYMDEHASVEPAITPPVESGIYRT